MKKMREPSFYDNCSIVSLKDCTGYRSENHVYADEEYSADLVQHDFDECRMTGIDLSLCTLKDVGMDHLQCAYSNLNGTKWERCEWDTCVFEGSDICDANWKMLNIHECNLSACTFMHMGLEGLDLSASLIDAIAVNMKDLKGLIVNQQQALTLSQLLGIVIKE